MSSIPWCKKSKMTKNPKSRGPALNLGEGEGVGAILNRILWKRITNLQHDPLLPRRPFFRHRLTGMKSCMVDRAGTPAPKDATKPVVFFRFFAGT